MLNKVKARLLIGLGSVAVTSFMVMIGYSIGSQSVKVHTDNQIKTEAKKLLDEERLREKSTVLSMEQVKEFLTQYYTKEKLGENNQRIKPLMTESAHKEELARQEESINQVYKDYIIDYRFDDAIIYIDTEHQAAFAEVTYQVTYVSDHGENAQSRTQSETKTVKLVYSKLSDKLLVNQMTSWNGKLEDLKEVDTEDSSASPEIEGSTTKGTI